MIQQQCVCNVCIIMCYQNSPSTCQGCTKQQHLTLSARDVQNNNTSHHPQFEMMHFNLLTFLNNMLHLRSGKLKLQQVKRFHCCIVTSSSRVILHLPPKNTKLHYLPGKPNLQQNCLLVVMVRAYNVCIASIT